MKLKRNIPKIKLWPWIWTKQYCDKSIACFQFNEIGVYFFQSSWMDNISKVSVEAFYFSPRHARLFIESDIQLNSIKRFDLVSVLSNIHQFVQYNYAKNVPKRIGIYRIKIWSSIYENNTEMLLCNQVSEMGTVNR